LRGRGTEMAFNRRTRREKETLAEVDRQLVEWRGWRVRLARLREVADATGALPAEEFASRLDALTHAVAALGSAQPDDPGASAADRLARIRLALEGFQRVAVSRRTSLEGLLDLPERFAAQVATADANSPSLLE